MTNTMKPALPGQPMQYSYWPASQRSLQPAASQPAGWQYSQPSPAQATSLASRSLPATQPSQPSLWPIQPASLASLQQYNTQLQYNTIPSSSILLMTYSLTIVSDIVSILKAIDWWYYYYSDDYCVLMILLLTIVLYCYYDDYSTSIVESIDIIIIQSFGIEIMLLIEVIVLLLLLQ